MRTDAENKIDMAFRPEMLEKRFEHGRSIQEPCTTWGAGLCPLSGRGDGWVAWRLVEPAGGGRSIRFPFPISGTFPTYDLLELLVIGRNFLP